MWERVHSTHRCLLLRRVPRSTIVFSQVRNNHLRVALSAECTRLEKWLLEVQTSLVNIKSRVDIIQSINDNV
ncbi:hypothetical protein HanXRQr2_Chr08g0345261 [Helianthus annuus]|uniref:Uncharacterized protein n=1 Tax=Helianthus annuus TaxID=4232 RepID=A0A9K3IGJ3_HELAN|nr:hypothetical protein HanXRQr2_Chr08g0345261 [Helianthus annuus]